MWAFNRTGKMKLDGNLAKLIVAAHKGNDLAQNAIATIEEVERQLTISCREHHMLEPKGIWKAELEETLALTLIEASPWLKSVAQQQEPLLV